jgi:sialidase-1
MARYDNSTSIAAKTQLACDTGLLGVGAWIADALPTWRPGICRLMWDAMRRPSVCALHPPPLPPPPPPLPPPVPPIAPIAPGTWTSPPPGAPGIDLFRSGDLGFANFRIPLLLSVPRASQMPTLLVFAEARKYSDGDWGSHGVVLRRSLNGGRSWTTARQVWSDPPARNLTYETHGHYFQPKAWVDNGGLNGLNLGAAVYDHETSTAILLMTMCSDNCTYFGCRQARSCRAVDPKGLHPRPHGRPSSHTYGRIFTINSTNGFRTWGRPVEITSQLSASGALGYPLGLGPGTGVQTKSGRLIVCGAMGIGSNVYYSDTHGRSWKAGGVVEDFGTNECDAVLLANNSVLLTLRSGTGFRIQARSDDEGLSFPDQRKVLDLPDSGCAAGIARVGGTLYIANDRNPSLKATWRTNMSLSLSTSGGAHWQYHSQVWTCDALSCPSGYSSLATVPTWSEVDQSTDNASDSLALAYERGIPTDMVRPAYFPYSFITFAVINPAQSDEVLASVPTAGAEIADRQTGGAAPRWPLPADLGAFLTIGQLCHPARIPIDMAGLFDSHDVVTVGLTLRKLKPSDDHFADFSSLLDAQFEEPIRRVGGNNIESMAQLLNYSSKFRIVEQAIIGQTARGAFEDVLEDAFSWNRNLSKSRHQAPIRGLPPAQLAHRYTHSLCQMLRSTGREWWLVNATFVDVDQAQGSAANRPAYFGVGFAQTIRLLKQTCVLHYALNLTVGVMLAADSGYSDFIFQNYTTYFPTAAGLGNAMSSATAPLVSFVDFFVVRGEANDIDQQTFTYSTAPVPSECSRGDDTVLRELTGSDRMHSIPAEKVIMGTTTVLNAVFDCPPSYPVNQLAPCFPSDECSVWSGWTAGDLDGNRAATLYENVVNGTVEYRYDTWAQTAYFRSATSESNCDGVLSNCFIELPTAQAYDFRLRQLRWRGARGLFTECADADFAAGDGSGRHWQQPAEVLRAFKASGPFGLRLPPWVKVADVDLESSADGLCRFFGGRGRRSTMGATTGDVTCFGPRPQSTFPFILVNLKASESSPDIVYSLPQAAAASAAEQLALLQLTSKAYVNRSGSILDPQYRREVPINAALADVLALAFNGTVANTSVVAGAASAGHFMGCAPALTKICIGSPGPDVCCSVASQFCPDYRSMVTFNRSAASPCDTGGTDVHAIGTNGAMSAVGSLRMYDGGISRCTPSDHDGGANCNPRGNLALPAINLLVGLGGGPAITWLNGVEENPFHVLVVPLKLDDGMSVSFQPRYGTPVTFMIRAGVSGTGLKTDDLLSPRPACGPTCFNNHVLNQDGPEFNPVFQRATALLMPLPSLPYKHHSWPIYFGPSAVNHWGPSAEFEQLLVQFARVTGALPLSIGTNPLEVAEAVKIARLANATLTLNYSPWMGYLEKHLPPTTRGIPESEEVNGTVAVLKNVSHWLDQANGTGLITTIVLDSEIFFTHPSEPAAYQQAVDRKHDLAFNLTREVFPAIEVLQFGRGGWRHDENDEGAGHGGWGTSAYYSLRERGQALGTTLYTVPEIGLVRDIFNKTVAQAVAAGEPCEGAARHCPVVPWISLGAGFRRGFPSLDPGTNVSTFPHPYSWTWAWDYDKIYSWQLGAELCRSEYAARPGMYAEYGRVKSAVLFPSPFDDRAKTFVSASGAVQSTAMLEHFVAYVRGAAGVTNTSDLLGNNGGRKS